MTEERLTSEQKKKIVETTYKAIDDFLKGKDDFELLTIDNKINRLYTDIKEIKELLNVLVKKID